MTEERFWELVSIIDWKHNCHKDKATDKCKQILIENLKENESRKEFREVYDKLFAELNKAILKDNKNPEGYKCEVWEATTQTWIDKKVPQYPYLSDDSWYDLRNHVVGCGKEDYYKVLNNPYKIADYPDYEECFSYVVG